MMPTPIKSFSEYRPLSLEGEYEWFVRSELIWVDDTSRTDMCSDKTVNKCLPSSVRNTEEQHFLQYSLHYSKHPKTFRDSPSLIDHQTLFIVLTELTRHRHATDAPPTPTQFLYIMTVGRLSTDCWPTVSRQSTDALADVSVRSDSLPLPSFKMHMTWKIFPAYLKGLSKYRKMAFFFLKYLFSF